MSCGCKQPNEDHGDQRNITLQDLQDAAQAGEVGPQEVVRNIQEGFQQFGQGQYQGAGTTTGQQAGQRTGNNETDFEQRQGGYGSGGSSGPQ